MANRFDYVSNCSWQEECPPQNEEHQYISPQNATNVQYPMSGYMPQNSGYQVSQNGQMGIPPSASNMQWRASTMTTNMYPCQTTTPMMQNMSPSASYNMPTSGYDCYARYTPQYTMRPPSCNMSPPMSPIYPPSENSDENCDSGFKMELNVPYLFINGKPVPMPKKEKNDDEEDEEGMENDNMQG